MRTFPGEQPQGVDLTVPVAEHLVAAMLSHGLTSTRLEGVDDDEYDLPNSTTTLEIANVVIEPRNPTRSLLEDVFAAELLLGYPRLRASLAREEMRDVAEQLTMVAPSERTYQMIIDVVIEYLLVSQNSHYGDEDGSRIFEAVV